MKVDKILFITLSNIGDVILTLPVLDSLRAEFPNAEITCMVSPRPKVLFQNNPYIKKLVIFDKHTRLREMIRLFYELKKEKFDVVIDLRNTFYGAFVPAKYRVPLFLNIPKKIKHMQERNLFRLQATGCMLQGRKFNYPVACGLKPVACSLRPAASLYLKPEDEEYINQVLQENGISKEDRVIIIAPGARSEVKRWPREKFVELIDLLGKEFSAKIILAGDEKDALVANDITKHSNYPVLDLTKKTSLIELACLLKDASCVITNDSAILHLSSYLDTPTVAIFGPTDEAKYGPWSKVSAVAKKDIFCRPCEKATCRFGTLACMRLVKAEDVLQAIKNILTAACSLQPAAEFKRILIVRTDRIGDVLLSTPVIKALRDNYPSSFIAMMVSPYAREIVEGNPYLDEVIICDKDFKHKSWLGSMKLALALKKKKFDLAIILHPTNRVHLVTFFSAIPERIGYGRKLGFLLTRRIKHTKQLGEKHEVDYNLDLLRYLGIQVKDKNLFMPISQVSEEYIERLLKQEGVGKDDRLLAIHPGASCSSKIWPNERFTEVADRLVEKYGFKILVVAGPKDTSLVQSLIKNMRHSAINLAGRTSVSQLASLLKRCNLFISNDSGPVHIASAVDTPVIAIFGRSQKGLSPKRWGPVGKKDKFIHKEVGCIECLAHNCDREFACLKAITVDDVLKIAESII